MLHFLIVPLATPTVTDPSFWDTFFTRFQAVGPTIAATIALLGAVLALRQKMKADRRDSWWKRVEWAAEKSLATDSPEAQALGAAALVALAADTNNDQADRDLLTAITDLRLQHIVDQGTVVEGDVEFEVDEE